MKLAITLNNSKNAWNQRDASTQPKHQNRQATGETKDAINKTRIKTKEENKELDEEQKKIMAKFK